MHNQTSQPSSLFDLQDECLKLLTGMFDIEKAASYLVDKRANPVCFKVHQIQPGMHREYLDHYQQFDPLHPSNYTEEKSDILRITEVVNLGERPDHPYCAQFMKSWGIQDTVEVYLRHQQEIVAGFSLFVGQRHNDFLTKDMRKLEQLHRFMQFSLEQCLSSPQQESFDSFCNSYNLTAKERMVVEQVLLGLPNKSISRNLCCSLATVKTHLQHIFGKLEVNSKAEIASLLYQHKTWH